MTTLNDTFERELTQEDIGYESRSKNTPLLSEQHHGYTMFLQVKICLSILPHPSPQLNNTQNTPHEDSEAAALYAAV